MGWLTGPTIAKQAIGGGEPRTMVIDAFGTAANPNNAGEVHPSANYSNYAVNGYGRNELVYACIRYRAESLPQAVLRVYPNGSVKPLNDHRLRQLFAEPNPITAEFEFFELQSTYKDLAGTCFSLIVRGRDGVPSELWPLRPDLVGVLPGSSRPTDFVWVYRPDPQRPEQVALIHRDDVMRIRYPNPNPDDPGWRWFGQPPLRAAARATTLDNGATDFVDSMLRNHAVPPIVVETEEEITGALHERLRSKWRQAFGGPRRGEPAFMQKGMKIHEIGLTLTDLEFPDLRSVSESRICMAFGVEPILVGTKLGLEHNAYKDYREARLSFWEESMITEMRRWVEPIRHQIVPSFNGIGRARVGVDWDTSGVISLREAEGDKWQRGIDALARGGITRNDFRVLVGLPRVPGGDVFLNPSGVIPQAVEPAADTSTTETALLAASFGVELSPDETAAIAERMELLR